MFKNQQVCVFKRQRTRLTSGNKFIPEPLAIFKQLPVMYADIVFFIVTAILVVGTQCYGN